MAEYWKSAPKYWCKQCKIYIRDTAFEKTQHEATGKHQGNLKRFLRDIHRENERSQRDSQRAKDEVERLKGTVSGKPGENQSSWKKATAAPTAAPQRPVSVEERKKQMAQLAEMGVAIPDQYRSDLALAGEWQTVSEKVLTPDEEAAQSKLGVRKRKHDVDEEEEEAKREAERFVSKGWGSATRRYPGAKYEEDLEDLDALLASTKDVKKAKVSGAEGEKEKEKQQGQDQDTAVEKDTRPGFEPVKGESEPETQTKEEEPSEEQSVPAAIEPEEPAAGAGVVFKKRKPKAMRK
ncbi:hypothetical protein BJY04DRAFT_187809 [Aspergillus karnatakaensis]|uniref:putative formin binding protein n=1 Tax=Aspergillus karnatakaensis TaxID=1810916 RepID=UPI003CCDC43E